jgi:hypothetical protein
VSDAALLFGLWVLIGGGLLSTLPFQPLRYYRPLVPALVFLAAWSLTAAADPGAERAGAWRDRATAALRWGVGLFAGVQILFAGLQAWLPADLVARTSTRVQLLRPLEFDLAPFLVQLVRARSFAGFAPLPREIAEVAALALCGALALAAGGILAIGLARPLVRAVRGLERRAPRAALGVVVLVLAWQAFLWVRWIPDRAWTLPAMSRELARLVPASAIVSPAGTYSLDNRLRYDSSAVRAGGMFDAGGGADYFVVLAGHPRIGILPPGEIERRYPGSVRVASFDLTGEYVYDLYRASAGPARRPPAAAVSPVPDDPEEVR